MSERRENEKGRREGGRKEGRNKKYEGGREGEKQFGYYFIPISAYSTQVTKV